MHPYFEVSDRLATSYAARFRAAGLMRYGLILPATLGAFIGAFGPLALRPAGHALQFVSLVAVILFSTRGGWARAQHRFLAYRALAEYLRNAQLLLPFAAAARPPEAAAFQTRVADWTTWFGRAVLRDAGIPSCAFGPEQVARLAATLRAQTEAQIAYLLDRAERDTVIAHRLQLIGVLLFASGIIFEAVRFGLVLTRPGEQSLPWFNELALVLPAMAPVFLGLLSFGEYRRLATRYQAVAAELQGLLAALARAPAERRAVLQIARRIANLMLAEGADWQLLIKARTVSAY